MRSRYPWSSTYYTDTPDDMSSVLLFPDFSENTVAKVDIEKTDKQITLKKQDGKWIFNTADAEFRADDFSVDTLLGSIKRLRKDKIVSSNPEKAAVYGMGSESAVKVKVYSDQSDELINLLVGKNLGALKGTYYKVPTGVEVYHTIENIRRTCDKGDDWIFGWREKRIFDFRREDIKGFLIQGPRGEIEIERRIENEVMKRAGWWMTRPRTGWIVVNEGNKMADLFSSLKTLGLVEDGRSMAELGLAPPYISITAHVDEASYKISLCEAIEKDARFMIVNDDKETVFKVPNYVLVPFLKKALDLLDRDD